MSNKSATVRDIAGEVQLSFSTVAAALRGDGWVPEGTRERVRVAAARMGYQRSVYAAVLSGRKPGARRVANPLVGYLTYGCTGRGAVLRAARHFGDETLRRGWLFVHENLESPGDFERIGKEWFLKGVDAVVLGVLGSFDLPFDLRRAFPWEKFVTVSLIPTTLEMGFDVVRPSAFRAVVELLRRMRERWPRIGIWLREHPGRILDDDIRLGACLAVMERDIPPEDRLPLLRTGFHQWVPGELDGWLRHHLPDALLVFADGDVRAVREAGWRVPEDLPTACLHVRQRLENNEEADRVAGSIAGLLDWQLAVPGETLSMIESKLVHRERGLPRSPREVVFQIPFAPGESLPRF